MNRRVLSLTCALAVFSLFMRQAHAIPNDFDVYNNIFKALGGTESDINNCNEFKSEGTCSGNSISGIHLGDRSLTGSIPPQIGDLKDLTHLDLSNNSLTGSIPTEIGTLALLTFLDLSNNELNGTIPSEIGSLGFLTHLDLSNNLLEGPLPPLPDSLTHLYVQGNLLCDKSLDFSGRNFYNCVLSEDDTAENCFAGEVGTCSVVSQVNGTVCGGCTPQPTMAPTMAPTAQTVAPTASPTKQPTSVLTASVPPGSGTVAPTPSTVPSTAMSTGAISETSTTVSEMSDSSSLAPSSSAFLTSTMSTDSSSTSFGSNEMRNDITTVVEEANSMGPIVGIAVGALLCLMIVFIVGCVVTRRRRRGAARSHTSPIVSPRKSPRSTLDRTRAHTRSPPARSPPAHSPRSQPTRPGVEAPAKPRHANRSKRASMRKSYRRSAHLKGGLGTFAPVGGATAAADTKKQTEQYGVMPTLGATEMYGMIPKAQANPESNYLALAPDEEPANAEQYDMIPIPNTATPISVVDGGNGATADNGHYLKLAPDEGF